MPDGWKEVNSPEGQVIYIDYTTMKFQLNRPTNGEFLNIKEIIWEIYVIKTAKKYTFNNETFLFRDDVEAGC